VWSSPSAAINSVVDTNIAGGPIAVERGREIYDQTSLWAVDRGANGTLSLTTPQAGTWHDIVSDDPFGAEETDEEKRFNQRLRDYLFKTRSNPRSGFWVAQKAAMRSVWAFGTAVTFTEESERGASSPISYRHIPLTESYLSVNAEGIVDTNFRVFRYSARSCVQRWGNACSAKVRAMAEDPQKKDQTVLVLHAVYPRDERGSYGNSNRESQFASCYVEIEEKTLIGESGYYEFPYRVDHWQRNNPGPYDEGPVAIALADIKSLNALAKDELRAMQQWVAPPMATVDDGMGRLNLNTRAVNPGFLSATGVLQAQPIHTVERPDFARAVIEARQNAVKSTLYLDLWQAILDSARTMTAEEVMRRTQEKGDLLGPVGSSLQTGLSFMVEREVSILERAGAFRPGSPLAAPETMRGRNIGVRFTSPLDRMRRTSEVQATEHVIVVAGQLAQAGKPEVLQKLDGDAIMDLAAEVLGAPAKIFVPPEVLQQQRAAQANANAAKAGAQFASDAGNAARDAAAGADAVANSPAASDILRRIAGLSGMPA
jgi:hypothetical protein